MNLLLDHSTCQHGGAYADRCLTLALLYPLGRDRPCMLAAEDDGHQALTVTLREGGAQSTLILENEARVREAAFDGYLAFEGHERGLERA